MIDEVPNRLPGGHLRPALPRGGAPARARRALARARAAAGRPAGDRGARRSRAPSPQPSAPRRSSSSPLLGRLVATAVQNLRAYEAERTTVGGAPPPVGAARGLRLARLARAPQPDGGRDRLGADAAAALARAAPGPAGGVPRRDRATRRRGSPRSSATCSTRRGSSRARSATRFSDVDLAEIVRDSAAAAEIGQDEVRLSHELPTALPRVRGDAERLRQLMDNLISNAVKYSRRRRRGAASSAQVDDGHVVVRVRDAGPGIAPEHQGSDLREVRPRVRQRASRARASGSSSRARSRRRTAARSTVDSQPGRGRDVHAQAAGRLSSSRAA